MKISNKVREKLYDAIFVTIVEFRVKSKFDAKTDVELAQLINKIWDKQKVVLKLDKKV